MKLLVPALLLAAAVSAQEPETYTSCHLTCAAANATSVCQNANWNDTSCLCNGDFQQSVKVCLYRSGCNTDVPSWFEKARRACESAGVAIASATGNYSRPGATGSRGGGGGGGGASAASSSAAAAPASTTASSASRVVAASAGTLVLGAAVAMLL
ncbi:hypothetical protein CC85DRAFT_310471 [Cutaneotrichosporon oleaginosum]|uniref:Extracellular membrane protein CFEM domain-containing protein n=1 Tax=Cutaneotrichosporon oleaginosum TaxID=879819 RepID=A0A0J0XXG1_9TREE|nr:uncharacterized protein CC85DRAFT_310471 [Cutaneotrichosporon oleaginosum]KLT45741.1 hypothetical protein CC85DRAFT_310471 [Cutaneotrichosporon oleaginosum]TXT04492.1 hypothetical protein COLE_07311 [Cutaneotrichosporon oleaginosum]